MHFNVNTKKIKSTDPFEIAAVTGALTDTETMFTAKEFLKE